MILKEPVHIYRDENGIPHIEANNELDLYRAYGYVHASERLFQLDLYRRASRGQLSEIFGPMALEKDKLVRTLNFEYPLHNSERVPLTREAKVRLRAYLEGLNSFIDEENFPIEFHLLGYEPEDFKFEDVYAFIGYMAYLFGHAPKQDPLFEKFREYYSDEIIALMGNDPALEKKELISSIPKNLGHLYDESLFYLPPVDGSNAWLVSGERSNSGKAILANDPHVGVSLPGLWFEAHLKSPSFEIYGHFLPLIPFAALGHNSQKAWGLTISYVDDMDIYKESIDWVTKKIKYRGQFQDLEKKTHIIKVKDAEDVEYISYIGPHGPLLGSTSVKDFSKPEYALQWTYHHKENRPIEAFYSMNYAKNIDEMRLAITLGTAPGLNFMYADAQNNIAWWMYGAIPIRPKGMGGEGVYPGESGRFDWLGHLNPDEKPQIENPASGIIVSANGRPPGADKTVRGYWQPQDRAKTIHDTLSNKAKWSSAEISELQGSSFNSMAEVYRDRMTLYIKQNDIGDEVEKKSLEVLRKWDGNSSLNSTGALIYHVFSLKLLRNLFDEPSDEDFNRYCAVNSSWRALYRFTELPGHEVWDIKKTSVKEQMPDVVLLTFKETIKELREKYSDDVSKWTWGKLHQIEFIHPLGSKGGVLGKLFNLGPFPVEGSYNSVNNFRRMGCDKGFSVRAGPSTRVVVNFEDTEKSLGGLPLGISGHFRSPYFSNERKPFLAGKPREQLMNWEKIKTYSALKLVPSTKR